MAENKAVDRLLQRYVDQGQVAGVSVKTMHHGQLLYRGMFGYQDLEAGIPMQEDTIFRIFSMSKVITAVAMLKLYEQGYYRMYDPVSEFLPGFKGQKVARVQPEGAVTIEPVNRPMVIRDLFTMTSGIPYGGHDSYSAELIRQSLDEWIAHPQEVTTTPLQAAANRIGRIPLAFHPGEHWMYGLSTDILGAIVEVISGKTLGEFMQQEIFDPLGMTDTTFHLPENKRNRLAQMYTPSAAGLRPFTMGQASMMDLFESGGGGLYSTVADYSRFCEMLVHGGTLQNVRILGRKTIDLMRTNHLTPEQRATDRWETQRGYGYGLMVRVLMEKEVAGANGSVGEFGWDGMAGTYMCVDPVEELTTVYMVQRVPGDHAHFVPQYNAAIYAML